ncbi:MAG: phosphoglucomutase/phosphomannomutase family protein [Acidobacteriota bacterium]
MSTTIKFGTDGWRAVIGEEFTFANVRACAQAVADYLEETAEDRRVAIGYDFRFLSEDFAAAAAEVLAANGVTVYLSPRACPTPHVSYFVHRRSLPLGIVITASHNGYRYNGFKLKERFGGSALPETTRRVEAHLGKTPPRRMSYREAKNLGRIVETPLDEGYDAFVESLVDIAAIRGAGLHVVVDSMNGVGERRLERWAASPTCRVATLRAHRDPLFGMRAPEPKEEYLDLLREAVLAQGADVGLATDGDADRSGGIHPDGSLFTPLEMIAVLALYLAEHRKQRGLIAATNANTLYLERIAGSMKLPYANRPVGFKYIAELMQKQDLLIGGEESGGITVQGFLPERDGVMINLLLLEVMVKRGKTSLELVKELHERFGEFHFRRRDFPVPPEKGLRQVARLSQRPPKEFLGRKVAEADTLDGLKLKLSDGSWVLLRQSGTEPSLRVYCEAPRREELDAFIEHAMKLLGEADRA